MAKKAKRPTPAADVAPGANPYADHSLLSRKMGTIMGCACLMVFILFKELWIGMLAFGIGFAIIYGLEVLVEKSKAWYLSSNLYLSIACVVLAFLERNSGFISNLMKFR